MICFLYVASFFYLDTKFVLYNERPNCISKIAKEIETKKLHNYIFDDIIKRVINDEKTR